MSPRTRQLSTAVSDVAMEAVLQKTMSAVPWLKTLRPPELAALARRGTRRLFRRYSTVTRGAAERTLCVHVVLSGRVRTEHGLTGIVTERGAGASTGEAALVVGTSHWPERVVAETDAVLLQFEVADFAGLGINRALIERELCAHYLSRVYYFRDLPDTKRLQVAGLMRFAWRPKGTIVFARGDIADRFYILVEGRVSMFREHKGMLGGHGSAPTSPTGIGGSGQMAGPAGGGVAGGPLLSRRHRRRSTLTVAGKPFLEFKAGSDINRGDPTPPWFGLTAVAERSARNATAICFDDVITLEIASGTAFRNLMAMLPGWQDIANAGADTFRVKHRMGL